MTIRDYRELQVWQKGHKLALGVYKASATFPQTEQFGLTSQIRRAAVSIPSNIVEGYERGSNREFKQFLIIARGSTGEVRAQLELAKDLDYLSQTDFEQLIGLATEVYKMLNAFLKQLQSHL